MFFWMSYPTKFETPTAGLFSNPHKVDNLESHPVQTTDYLWHLLAEIEFKISNEKVVLDRFHREIEEFNRKPFSEKTVHRIIKFFYLQLCIKHSIRDLKTDGLIKHVRSMFEFADNDQTIPIEAQINSAIKLAIFALFLKGLSRSDSYVFPYEELKKDIISSGTDYKSISAWIDALKEFFALNHRALYQYLTNLNEPNEKRLIAAGILSFSPELSPSEYFYTDVSLVCYDLTLLRNLTEDFLEDIIKNHWLEICEKQAFNLRNPRVNIPLLRKACESKSLRGFAKVADILLTAQPAVGMTIHQLTRESLMKLKG
jgi:hypothetical protein